MRPSQTAGRQVGSGDGDREAGSSSHWVTAGGRLAGCRPTGVYGSEWAVNPARRDSDVLIAPTPALLFLVILGTPCSLR